MKTNRSTGILLLAGCLLWCDLCAQEKDRWSTEAPPDQAAAFLSLFGKRGMIAVPESREHPLRILDALPAAWMDLKSGSLNRFAADARPGEYFVFQVGVYAPLHRLEGVKATTGDFAGSNGQRIGVESATCFNTGGIGFEGSPIAKTVNIEKGRLQPLWLGIQIPDAAQGTYNGVLTVSAHNAESVNINVTLNIQGAAIANGGVDEGNRLARLKWLNSTIGNDDRVTKGFEPILRTGNSYRILGREVTIGGDGLPWSIRTCFAGSNERLTESAQSILQSAMRLVIETNDGGSLALTPGKLVFTKATPKALEWQVHSSAGAVDLVCKAHAEFDGFIDYRLALTVQREIAVRDIRLEIPMRSAMAGYIMGMGQEGGFRPDTVHWIWDVEKKNQDMVWVGSVNGGLRLKLKAENYRRPLINVYYKFNILKLPPSWGNAGKGGADITSRADDVLLRAYSGPRIIHKGEQLNFDFELLITPVRLLNRDVQFGDRYYHTYKDVSSDYLSEAALQGANIVNIHHKSDINPFINYPYLDRNVPYLKEFIETAHARNVRVKLYYTTRELTVNIPEFWALRSLNGEIIFPGPGNATRTVIHPNGAPQWLVDNLKEDYIPAWVSDFNEGRYKGVRDIAVITTPDSRWNNFYLEGVNWMANNLQFDGMYVDDSALDRGTVQRARKILDDTRPEARIDLHSWNHFCEPAGWTNCLNLYMDMLPYFDLVWIGEGRDYNKPPDHWLVEVSGIPFGLSGQMLEGGGNRWRGMVYGITNRLGWVGPSPSPIWKFWDAFRIRQKEMVGYWDENSPVQCSSDSVKVTVYRGGDQTILALGNWGKSDQIVTLNIDYGRLGMTRIPATFHIPAIKDFQEERRLNSLERLFVRGGEGCLVVFENKSDK